MFVKNAGRVVRRSWSFQLSILLAVVAAVQLAAPLWVPGEPWFSQANIVALCTFLGSVGTAVSRLINQDLCEDPEE